MELTVNDALFYAFALVAVIGGVLVIFASNPVYSALFLALTMSVLGAMYFTLDAYFIAVAQITVYAGAVMVLFVMVVMLFDLRKESEEILKFSPVTVAKVLSAALLCGFLVGTAWLAVSASANNPASTIAPNTTVADLSKPADGKLPPSTGTAQAREKSEDEAKPAAPGVLNTPVNPDEDLTAAEEAKLVDQGQKAAEPETAAAATAAGKAAEQEGFGSTVELSKVLFSKFVFAFEAVSVLLLIAIVGAVALAKSRGGTHHVA